MTFFDLIGRPEIRVRLLPDHRIVSTPDGKSLVVKSGGLFGPPFARNEHAWKPANTLLESGALLRDLRNLVLKEGGSQLAASWLIAVQNLYRYRIIELILTDEAGDHATLFPQWDNHVPRLADAAPPPEIGLDRFACLRRAGEGWLLESPLAGVRLRLPDPGRLEVPLVRRALAAEGFLETARSGADSPRQTALRQWEFHDLLFHWHQRPGWHSDPSGAGFPFIGEVAPQPAVRPPWPGRRVALPNAPEEAGGNLLTQVLERRRSVRTYDETHPISFANLGALLDRAARIRKRTTVRVGNAAGKTSEFEITERPYPNGGASYELEIYVVVDRCDGLESGMYHYDAATHELVEISGRTPDVEGILAEAKLATAHLANPQIVLTISARFARVMWKYRSISYGVILRNVGALYQTLYLVATDLGISPCGLGSGNSARFARTTGLDPVVEGSVGEFILGGPPAPA